MVALELFWRSEVKQQVNIRKETKKLNWIISCNFSKFIHELLSCANSFMKSR